MSDILSAAPATAETTSAASRQQADAHRLHAPVAFDAPDGVMAGRTYGDRSNQPLLFCHANGFCASTYRQMASALAQQYFVLALDLRGHGRTSLPADPRRHRSYDIHARDIAAAVAAARERFSLSGPWVFAGHSMGAVSALLAAAGRQDVSAVRLVEPVIMPAVFRAIGPTPLFRALMRRSPLVRGALGRRAEWADRESVLVRYREKALFRNWAPGVLEDYLEDGLVETAEGVRLACTPAWEAANFMAQGHDIFGALKRLSAPVSILVASGRGSTVAPGGRSGLRRHGADLIKIDAGHLAAMERPRDVAAFVAG